MKHSSIEKACAECGASMIVKRCLINRKKYCSRSCQGRSTIQAKMATRKLATSNSGWFTTEGSRGANSPSWVDPVMFTCAQCQRPFGLKPHEVKRRTVHCGYAPRFCSTACHLDHKRAHPGIRSPYWTGRNSHYRGAGWRKLRLAVIRRQHGRCAECGAAHGTRLHVHHVERFHEATSVREANRDENLVALCRRCHGRADGRVEAFRAYNVERQQQRANRESA